MATTANFHGMNSSIPSPRSSGAREVLTMARKFRAPSRQSSQGSRINRKQQAKPLAEMGSLNDSAIFGGSPTRQFMSSLNNGTSLGESGLLPQIKNTSSQHGHSSPANSLAAMPKRLSIPNGMNSLDTYGGMSYGQGAKDYGSGLTVTSEELLYAGVTSVKGMKPGNPNWINQDNFFLVENFEMRDIHIYCVLDGHGENGHHVSRRCRENFPHFIRSTNMQIDQAFNMMQNDLTSSDIDVRCSGATCVLVCIINTRLIVYNCGDSRAILARRTASGSLVAHPLSNDHKPDKPEERKRILSCGGHLGCRQVLVNQGNRGPVSMPVGPCRVWYQHRGETLGLAMSRSLGDAIVHKVGVTAEPEITDHAIDDHDEFVILATDGVWDVVDNNHAVQMVQSIASRSANWSPLEASNTICRFARSRWEKLSPMIDDITCIVVKIHR